MHDRQTQNLLPHYEGLGVSEHDRVLQRVINSMVKNEMQLFKQFMDNKSFQCWLADKMFSLIYRPRGRSCGFHFTK